MPSLEIFDARKPGLSGFQARDFRLLVTLQELER